MDNIISDESFEAPTFESPVEGSEYGEAPKRKINLKPAIRWVLYIVTFLVPLFFLPWTSEFLELNKQSVLIIAAGVGLVLFLAEMIQNGTLALRTSRLYLPLGAVIVASVVSAVLSKNPYQSLLGSGGGVQVFSLASILALAVIFFLVLNVIEDRGQTLKKVAVGSVGIALLISILQVFGVFFGSNAPFNSYGFNTVGSLNSLAILGALFLPLFLEAKWRVVRFIDVGKIALALALFLIVLVNWWVIWVVTFVSLVAWMAFKILETGRTHVSNYIFPMSIIVVGVLLMLVNFSVPVLKSRLPIEVAPSFSSSLQMTTSVLKESPIYGYGLGEFSIAYDKFKPVSIAQTIFARTHFAQATSSAFTLIVEGGLLLALAALFLLVMSVLGLYKSHSGERFLVLSLLVVFFLFPFNLTLLFFLFLSLAFLELQSSTSSKRSWIFEESPRHSLLGSLAFIVGLVLVLAGGYFVTLRYVADAYYVQAVKGTNADEVITDFTESININPQDTRYYRLLSQAIMIKLSNDLNDKADKTPAQQRTQRLQNLAASSVEIAKRATDVDPNNVENWINRGLIYQNLVGLVGGADQAAINMFTEALQRSPADPTIYNSIGSVYLTIAENARVFAANPPANQPNLDLTSIRQQAANSFRKAEENYKKAIELNNNYGQALFALGVVYEREGQLGNAIKQFERLRVGSPNDPSIAFELGLLYYRNGQKDAAFNQLQQATTLFPNYSNARWYLSLLYEERGDIANALAQVVEIERSNPDNELVKQRIAQLQSGTRLIPPARVLDQKPL